MTKPMRLTLCASAVSIALAALHGCGGGNGESSFANQSTLSVAITDAPVDGAKKVEINFTGLELKHENGNTYVYEFCGEPLITVEEGKCTSTPVTNTIDLLVLTGGQYELLLDEVTIPHGNYNWIRLILDDTTPGMITLIDDTEHELAIPSGAQTGLKLNRGFTVAQGGNADFTIDFDLRKSVHQTGNGDYKLRPTLRLIDNVETGRIAGTVANGIITQDCSPAVYLYKEHGVTPGDEGSANAPLASTLVALNEQSQQSYKFAFVEAGDYTVALTCEADLDDPAKPDTIEFVASHNVTVVADETAAQDFAAP